MITILPSITFTVRLTQSPFSYSPGQDHDYLFKLPTLEEAGWEPGLLAGCGSGDSG